MMLARYFAFCLLQSSGTTAHLTRHTNTSAPLPNHLVAQFADDVWLENIAIRSNGNLLLTTLQPNASLYEVSKPMSKYPTISRLLTIDTISGLTGITETAQDVFIFTGANFSMVTGGTQGTTGVWKIDFGQSHPEPKLVTYLPESLLPNGVAAVPQNKSIVLIADAQLGLVWRVDSITGEYDVVAKLKDMGNLANGSTFVLGIDGMRIHKGNLYWTNNALTSLYELPITRTGSPVPGAEAKLVAKPPVAATDDFIFGPGNSDIAWLTTNFYNELLAVMPNGDSMTVAGGADSFEVATATACRFGRTRWDATTLYVTTGPAEINGVTKGGKVQAINLSGFI
ncbi:Six-bladed beta-propeller [Fusarium acutatum]|uniref:Six-bladed beta-propeller n=1 Tax=Fusarium acutatum TaxID=78861 RepID=A0A8H4JIW5_9HYPO|nr:Six-bladed beta-propeller [Fusarium acutatum]